MTVPSHRHGGRSNLAARPTSRGGQVPESRDDSFVNTQCSLEFALAQDNIHCDIALLSKNKINESNNRSSLFQ